jgi:hypothetical protein
MTTVDGPFAKFAVPVATKALAATARFELPATIKRAIVEHTTQFSAAHLPVTTADASPEARPLVPVMTAAYNDVLAVFPVPVNTAECCELAVLPKPVPTNEAPASNTFSNYY